MISSGNASLTMPATHLPASADPVVAHVPALIERRRKVEA